MSYRIPDPGELNRRVSIRVWEDLPSAAFALDHTEGSPLSVWAKLESVGAMAFYGTAQTGEGLTHRAWMWRIDGTRPEQFTGRHVIEHDGQRFRVLRAIDVNGERNMTVVELKLLGAAT